MGVGEPHQEEPPEQAGQHAHWQQEAGSAVHPVRTNFPVGSPTLLRHS
jgi:hypothetical protein